MKLKNEQVVIDGIDKKILRSLISDARTPILEIARNVGISGAAIHQRLRKLEKSGLIAGSKFVINPKVLGYHTMALRQLEAIPEVIECHYTTGIWSIFLKILCRDNSHLMEVLNKEIQAISGVSRTETFISLEQQIERQIKI